MEKSNRKIDKIYIQTHIYKTAHFPVFNKKKMKLSN